MNTLKQALQTVKIVTLATVLSFGLSYVYAWTAPNATPPNGNTSAPVNVGTTDQIKNSGLSVNAFTAFGNAYFGGNVGIGAVALTSKLEVAGTIKSTGLQMTTGAGVGKVLTSDATGSMSWETPTGSSGSYGRYTFKMDGYATSYLFYGTGNYNSSTGRFSGLFHCDASYNGSCGVAYHWNCGTDASCAYKCTNGDYAGGCPLGIVGFGFTDVTSLPINTVTQKW